MKNLGTIEAPIVAAPRLKDSVGYTKLNDAAIANNMAFLTSELEKRENIIRQPLTSVTYTRDIPIKVGGGWVDTVSALNIGYGITEGSENGPVIAAGGNEIPVIQGNLEKDIFRSHVFSVIMRLMFVDVQRSAITGRNLDSLLQDGIRLTYDKHQDANVYTGISKYGTTGLLNNPNVVTTNVPNGAAGNSTWATKTADEILADINAAIEAGWAAAAYDRSAIPNHILIPYQQYNLIATRKVTDLAEKTILTFLLENNIATLNGSNLVIGATAFNQGAGASGTDRLVAYRNDDRFVAVEELVPLSRVMTSPNTDAVAYDSVFMANLSEVEFFYTAPVVYYDGI